MVRLVARFVPKEVIHPVWPWQGAAAGQRIVSREGSRSKKKVLFIGTQFSNLSTAVDKSAAAA